MGILELLMMEDGVGLKENRLRKLDNTQVIPAGIILMMLSAIQRKQIIQIILFRLEVIMQDMLKNIIQMVQEPALLEKCSTERLFRKS